MASGMFCAYARTKAMNVKTATTKILGRVGALPFMDSRIVRYRKKRVSEWITMFM